jgi:hypothetical protein
MSLMLGEVLHLTYVVAQIEPIWASFMPTSVMAGIGNSLCWTILGMYLTLCAKIYARQTRDDFIRVQINFFGMSTCIFMTCEFYFVKF